MKEHVIFPEPQDVNILATRKGELTQIPGTEFRAPIVPFEAAILPIWHYNYKALRIETELDVVIRGNWLRQGSTYYAIASESSFVEPPVFSGRPSDSPHDLKRTYIKWKQHPKNTSGYKPSPDPDRPIYVHVEIFGYKSTETIHSLNKNYGAPPVQVILPELVGVQAELEMYNPEWDDSQWEW